MSNDWRLLVEVNLAIAAAFCGTLAMVFGMSWASVIFACAAVALMLAAFVLVEGEV